MRNALQEQLLKAGLATEEQLEKAQQARQRPRPKARKKPKSRPRPKPAARQGTAPDLKAAWDARQKAEQEEAAEKARLKARRKANRKKIRKLIANNTLNIEEAEIGYQFIIGSNIKKVYVTGAQRQQLLAGELAITFLDGKRCVITRTVADEVLQLDPGKVMVIQAREENKAEDEEYAGFEVPDDLTW